MSRKIGVFFALDLKTEVSAQKKLQNAPRTKNLAPNSPKLLVI
jgi:hypothetical protein